MKTYLNGRPIMLHNIDHGEDYCDSFAQQGEWLDTGQPLTEEELSQANDKADFYEEWLEYRIGRAEDFGRGD